MEIVMVKTIRQLIDEKIAIDQKQREGRVRSGKYSPSSFGQCFRKQYWNRQNEPQTNPSDERNVRIMLMGTLIHQWVRENISKDENIEYEKRIETDHVLGFADMVRDQEVVDVKTEHSYAKKYRNQDGFSIIESNRTHCLQVGWYALKLGKSQVRLCYIDRDNFLVDEYVIELSKIKEMVEEEVNTLVSYWITNTLPKASPRCYGVDEKTGKPKECMKYCNYKDKCIQQENQEGRTHPLERS